MSVAPGAPSVSFAASQTPQELIKLEDAMGGVFKREDQDCMWAGGR